MLGWPHKSKASIEEFGLIERDDAIILSLLFKYLLDILCYSRVLLQCLHKVVFDVTCDGSYYASDYTSQIRMIAAPMRSSKKAIPRVMRCMGS